jgi:hypothetical protein
MNDGANLADASGTRSPPTCCPMSTPRKPGTSHGAGDPCAVCDEPIQPAQVEYRIGTDTNITHRFHLGCFRLWTIEVLRRRWAHPERRPGLASPFQAIRAKLRANILPIVAPLRAQVRKGTGEACSGCDASIESAHTQWVVEFGAGHIVRLHEDCERIWRTETGN